MRPVERVLTTLALGAASLLNAARPAIAQPEDPAQPVISTAVQENEVGAQYGKIGPRLQGAFEKAKTAYETAGYDRKLLDGVGFATYGNSHPEVGAEYENLYDDKDRLAGGIIYMTPKMANNFPDFIDATALHEFGHAVRPELRDVWAANEDKYGPDAPQTVEAHQLAENSANIIAAGVSGQVAVKSGGTQQQGIQKFVDGYLGHAIPGSDKFHGSLFEQLGAISEAYPDVALKVPTSVLKEIGASPNTILIMKAGAPQDMVVPLQPNRTTQLAEQAPTSVKPASRPFVSTAMK